MTSASKSKPTRLRVAVMGAGAVGGYLGGILARAGHSVALIDRGAHLRAIQSNGLRVQAENSDFIVRVPATDNPAEIGPVDLVVHAVKTYHNPEAIPMMRPLVNEGTTVLTIQNGVDSWEQLNAGLGHSHVLPGAIYIETRVEAPGVVRRQGNVYRLVLGEADGPVTPPTKAIAQAFQAASLPTEVATDIHKVLWTKWLFIATLAGVTTAAHAGIAEVLAVPASRELVIQVMREIEAVGRKRGIDLDKDVVDKTLRYMENEARSLKASMQTDMEAGRPMELEALTGTVVRLGRESGVPTLANDTIYRLLKPHELKRQPLPRSEQ